MRMLTDPGDPTVDAYLTRVAEFRQRLLELDFRISPTPSYITSVELGGEYVALQVRDAFPEQGFQVPVFSYPAVRRNHAVLRIMLNSGHTDAQIESFLETLVKLRDRYRF
jgi:7-keto-8-aminopelargonate synthetase-like enzyme